MSNTYPYDLTTYFGGTVNEAKLRDEVNANTNIVPHCSDVGLLGTDVVVTFLGALDAAEQTELEDVVIPAHDSTPTPDDVIQTEVTNRVTTEVRKPDGLKHDRVYGFSINFCDRTTWFHDAVEATDQFTAVAAQTDFQLAHGTSSSSPDAANEAIIDLSHGKVGDENDIRPAGGFWRAMGAGRILPGPTDPFGLWGPNPGNLSGYVPIVTVDGVEKIERSYGEATGGDYVIDYDTGIVTFDAALVGGEDVEVTYFWVDSNAEAKLEVTPGAGKKFLIEKVEIQTTADVVIKSDMVSNVFVDSAVFGLPPGTPMQSRRPTILKNFQDVHNWAHLIHPEAQTQAPGDPRGLSVPIRVHEVRYLSEIPLLASMGAVMKVAIQGNKPFGGTWASVVVYGITDDE